MLEEKRKRFKKLEYKIGNFFSKTGIHPNHYTLISLFFVLFALYFMTRKNLILSLVFFFVAAFLDLIDGAVARATKKDTKKGAYLDTVCDRYVEGIILLGFFSLPLPSFILPSEVWIAIALFGSLMTTYSKAAAKEKELVSKELRKGFLGRGERIILIISVMVLVIFNLSLAIYPLIILALLSNITAIQRIYLSLAP